MRQRSPLRFDRDLDHTLSPLAKELVCLGDFVQIKRVSEKGCVTTLFRGQRANAQAEELVLLASGQIPHSYFYHAAFALTQLRHEACNFPLALFKMRIAPTA